VSILLKSALLAAAELIQNATTTNFNTATRVGSMFYTIIDSILSADSPRDIRLYGEVGTVDDSATLTLALAAVPVGGAITIPAGVTVTVENVTLTSRKLNGAGTLKWKAASVVSMLNVTGADCELSGIVLDGDSVNQASSAVAIALTTAPRFRLVGCNLTNFRGIVLRTDEGGELSPDGTVLDCKFYDTGTIANCNCLDLRSSRWSVIGTEFTGVGNGHCIRTGLYTDNIGLGPVKNTRIIGCHFEDTEHCGVTNELHTQGCLIDACTFENMEQAVKSEIESKSVFDITVSNCLIKTMSLSSVVNLSGPLSTFVNNRCYDWAGGLIFNSDGIATGNYFENCGSLAEVQATINVQTAGIYAAEGDFTFADNVIVDSPYRGISCSVGKLKAVGNVLRNCADRAFNVGGADNTIIGNTVDGATFGLVMSTTMATSVVEGNTFANCSSSVYSFTFNAAFASVILKDNVGTEPSFHNTIASGVALGGLSPGMYTLGTEGAAATDDLDTITPATNTPRGHIIVLSDNSSAQDVTVKHNTGNIILAGGADFAMANTSAKIALQWSGTKWQELWRATA
jgi:hypothetical protein